MRTTIARLPKQAWLALATFIALSASGVYVRLADDARRVTPAPGTAVLQPVAPHVADAVVATGDDEPIVDPIDIFAVRTWEPPKPPPPKPLPPPPPQAPPLPFRFIGKIDDPDRGPAFLLADSSRVIPVSVGDEIDGIYHVEKFEGGQLHFRYRPLNLPQTLFVGSAP